MARRLINTKAMFASTGEDQLEELLELATCHDEMYWLTKEDDIAFCHAAAAGQVDMVRSLLVDDDEGRLADQENEIGRAAVALAIMNRHVGVLKVFAEHAASHLQTALRRASGAGDVQRVELLLQLGVDPTVADQNSALYEAVCHGHVDMAKVLLKNGAAVHLKSGQEEEPVLFPAVRLDSVDMIDLLIQYGASVHATDRYNSTPLLVAATRGHIDAVDILLKHGAEISCSVLFKTCHYGQVEAVALLLDHGVKVFANTGQQNPMCAAARAGSVKILELLHDCGFDINPSDQRMISTPLHEASEIGYVAVVEWLLAHGANVDATDGAGKTSLHHAVNRKHSDVVTLLLEHGAQADIQDAYYGWTALHEVCALDDEEEGIALQLIKYGSNANIVDMANRTPLFLACLYGKDKIAAALLDRVEDIDVNIEAQCGTTALFHACRATSLEVVRDLLDRGADPFHVSSDGQTTIHSTSNQPRPEVLKLLLTREVDANAVDNYNNTALQNAVSFLTCSRADFEFVELLLECGVSPHRLDDERRSVFQRACVYGWVDMVKVCLKYGPYTEEKDEYYTTALEESCLRGQLEVVRMLLQLGVKASYKALLSASHSSVEMVQMILDHNVGPNDDRESQRTPLHEAASRGKYDIVQLLLANGASVHVCDSAGCTVLHAACQQTSERVLSILLDHGVEIDAQDENGDTALHIAVLRSTAACVESLLKSGADTGILNVNGETPLGLSASTYRAAMIPLLAEYGADIEARNHAGSTPLAQCLRKMTWISELRPIYETAYELVVCGASKSQVAAGHIQHAALEYLVEWWIDERDSGKSLTFVPTVVLRCGLAATERFLLDLREKTIK